MKKNLNPRTDPIYDPIYVAFGTGGKVYNKTIVAEVSAKNYGKTYYLFNKTNGAIVPAIFADSRGVRTAGVEISISAANQLGIKTVMKVGEGIVLKGNNSIQVYGK